MLLRSSIFRQLVTTVPIALLCIACPASGLNCRIQTWVADDGLLQNSAADITQAPEGDLLIGSCFGDLVRFDGVRFSMYDISGHPEWPRRAISRLLTDDQGNISWYGLDDGACSQRTWRRHPGSLGRLPLLPPSDRNQQVP